MLEAERALAAINASTEFRSQYTTAFGYLRRRKILATRSATVSPASLMGHLEEHFADVRLIAAQKAKATERAFTRAKETAAKAMAASLRGSPEVDFAGEAEPVLVEPLVAELARIHVAPLHVRMGQAIGDLFDRVGVSFPRSQIPETVKECRSLRGGLAHRHQWDRPPEHLQKLAAGLAFLRLVIAAHIKALGGGNTPELVRWMREGSGG